MRRDGLLLEDIVAAADAVAEFIASYTAETLASNPRWDRRRRAEPAGGIGRASGKRVRMEEGDRRRRLIGWLEVIFADLQQLLLNDHLFWEFQGIVERNDEFLNASGLFTQFIASAYVQSATTGIRRQVKHTQTAFRQ